MKELSIEEKAKAYDEIIKKANKMHHENCEACQACIEELIPELAETEDERIRKSLIILLQHFCKGYRVPGLDFPVSYKDMLAWVERQGEHANFINKIQIGDKVTRNEYGVLVNLSQLKRVAKPANKEQKDTLEDAILDSNEDGLIAETIRYKKEKQGEQKPAEWSEEDEKMLEYAINIIEWYSVVDKSKSRRVSTWLKSLKDRHTWKPSEEQMDALRYVTNFDYGGYKATLVSLYEQLKKLKG